MSVVFSGLEVTNLVHGDATTTFAPVRAATTADGALATAYENGDAIDGVTLATGDRILLKDQSTASENGVYEVQASGAPVREADLEVGASANGFQVFIKEGTANKNTSYVCTADVGSDVVDTNNLTFTQNDTTGTLSVARGGTGAVTHGSGNVLVGAGTSAPTSTKSAPTGDFVGTSDAQTMTNKTLTTPIMSGDITFDEATNDLTLAVADQASGTGTFTIPDLGGVSGDAVVTNLTQTLSNKTLSAPIVSGDIIFDEASGDLTLASSDQTGNATITVPDLSGTSGDMVVSNATQTLTNKTLTSPIISTISNTGTLTLPTATTTLVGTDTTDTLTNKTFGDDLAMGGNKITGVGTPTADTDASTKGYVDSIAQGLAVKEPVRLASTSDLDSNGSITGTATYTSTGGTSARGQITATLSVSDTFTVDGVNLGAAQDGTRILLKDQTNADENGIWVTTISGTGLTLDRAADYDEDDEVNSGDFMFVTEGTALGDNGYVLSTDGTIIVGGASGTNLAFTQFSGTGQISAGDGLTKTGNVLDVDLKANGGLVIESTEIAINLSATSITGTLVVGDGGTGATTHTSNGVLLGAGTSAVTSAKQAPSGAFVGTTDVQTLTNKTLTSPKIGTNILDTNGNELVVLTATASAVNELTLANGATGNNPSWTASGGDTDVGMDFTSKGTGVFTFAAGSASAPGEIRLEDHTGGEYVAIDVPAAVTTYTLTLPSAVGAAGEVLRAADGSGNLEFSKAPFRYMWQPNKIVANTVAYSTVAYFGWDDSEYTDFATGKVIFYHDVGANRNLDVDVYDGGSVIGSLTVTAGTAAGIATFTITNPTADKNLELRVKKSSTGGANPCMFGVQLEFAA